MESKVKKKTEIAEIANPTYDVVFKYMMDDKTIEKLKQLIKNAGITDV